MTSRFTAGYFKRLKRLPKDVQRRTIKTLELLEQDARYPSLHFKELSARHGAWSARVSRDYRMVGYRDAEVIEWFWVGPHDQYDKLLNRLS